MKDYLDEYSTPEGFDLLQLFNDDYFVAIKLLYNNGLFVSTTKLLMSAIDTVAFLEFGDCHGNFTLWLDKYADVPSLNVTSAEVWELRNSLLHMTNLDSRKVLDGKVKRLQIFVGDPPEGFLDDNDEFKRLGLWQFIQCVSNGITKYGESFNLDPDKWGDFFMRYDRIISDSRYTEIN